MKIEEHKRELGRSEDETTGLVKILKNGENLVGKCETVTGWRKVHKRPLYSKKLKQLDEDLIRFFNLNMLAQLARDASETLVDVKKLSDIMGGRNGYLGSCGVPSAPAVTFGLDVPLKELKMKMDLLKDDDPMIVLSAPGGCGKTTLATKFCEDKEVKGKYKNNILFVTVSKTPDLKVIIQRLIQQKGNLVPDFLNDEDAVHHLEQLLKQLGSGPVLLVLDDVWSRSESLLEKFVFHIPDYRILVTSRSKFPRFSTYKLGLLNDANGKRSMTENEGTDSDSNTGSGESDVEKLKELEGGRGTSSEELLGCDKPGSVEGKVIEGDQKNEGNTSRKKSFKEVVSEDSFALERETFLSTENLQVEVQHEGEDDSSSDTSSDIPLSAEGKKRLREPWTLSLIIKVVGKRVTYPFLLERLRALWKITSTIYCIDVGEGFFVIKAPDPQTCVLMLNGGPWFVAGHFLAVRKWVPHFNPTLATVTMAAMWVILPKLPQEYYDSDILRAVGNKVGKLLKVEVRTERNERGRYARLCVQVDLSKPLRPSVTIGRHRQVIQFEGLHKFCFNCGRVGHVKESCVPVPNTGGGIQEETISPTTIKEAKEDNTEGFGPWIQVIDKRKARRARKHAPAAGDTGNPGEEGPSSGGPRTLV